MGILWQRQSTAIKFDEANFIRFPKKILMEQNFIIAAKIDKSRGVDDYPLEIISNLQDCTKFAVGHSSGSIHLMDLNSLQKPLMINNEQVLNRIAYDPVDANLLWFGTHEGLNCVDLRLQTKVLEIQKMKNEFLSFDVSQSRLAAVGTELFQDSPLLFYDLRNASAPIQEFQVHSDDITQVKFNPADPNLMMTGSTDGLFCLYNLSSGLDEDEALYQCIRGVVFLADFRRLYSKDWLVWARKRIRLLSNTH